MASANMSVRDRSEGDSSAVVVAADLEKPDVIVVQEQALKQESETLKTEQKSPQPHDNQAIAVNQALQLQRQNEAKPKVQATSATNLSNTCAQRHVTGLEAAHTRMARAGAKAGGGLESLVQGEELDMCRKFYERVPDARPDQIVRFLRAREGDLDNAEQFLKTHLSWRKTNLPVEITPEVRTELEKLKYAVYGRDKDGRVVVVVRVRLMGKHTYDDLSNVEKACIVFAEYLEHVLDPLGQLTVLYSRVDAGRKNFDLDNVKLIATLFQDNYPERLYRAYVAPVGIFLRSAWHLIQVFLDPDTKAKLSLVKDPAVFKDPVSESSLPKELGGQCMDPFSVQDLLQVADEWYKTGQQ